MIREIAHVGVTVSDIDRSIAFYRDVLGLEYQGRLVMQGKETDLLFGLEGAYVDVAYLNGSEELMTPPVELICFKGGTDVDRMSLTKTSISEICFRVEDIDATYERLMSRGVEFLSKPQLFDFTGDGFGKSKAVYLRDPDGIILELMEYLK